MKTLTSVFFSILVAIQVVASGVPSVKFTIVPPRGDDGAFEGEVQNVDRTKYSVAFMVNVYGTWWRKPYDTTPALPINPNNKFGFWQYWTGGIDHYAQQFAAFVVPISYTNTIPDPHGSWKIPDEIYSNSIAYTIFDRRTPSDYTSFAGYTWEKKVTNDGRYGGDWGPGPSHFFSQNAHVDGSGRLHMEVTESNGWWYCSEVILTNKLGYGLYRFKINNDLQGLPPALVLGLFTWSDDPAYTHREIDVEYSEGKVVGDGGPNVWQNVIQPWNTPGNRYMFPSIPNLNSSVHEFLWTSNSVSFNNFGIYSNDVISCRIISSPTVRFNNPSDRGLYQSTSKTNTPMNISYPGGLPDAQFFKANFISLAGNPAPFQSHSFSNSIPKTGGELVHINLWINEGSTNGLVPGRTYGVEISDFEFIPLDQIGPRLEILNMGSNSLKLGLSHPSN
ncbi:MAG: hypothetical protein WC827_02950 [Candidatus Paceibacterota bacterium]|jgi:hypothetical protein